MCGGADPASIQCPTEILDLSGVRLGKSLFGAALILWMTQFVVALKIDGCKAVMQHLLTPMLEKPALRSLLVDDPKDLTLSTALRGLKIRHPSGHVIEVVAVPLDRGGGSGVSVYSAGVVVDEYPRMIGADDGVRNVEHFRDAVAARILPGGKALYTGSPWQPYGPAYDNTVKFFGKPTQDILVLRTSARPFVGVAPAWTEKSVEKLKRSNPTAYKTDFLAEFADGEEAVFPAQAIEDAWNKPRNPSATYGRPAIFADPSALRHDYWAAMVGGWAFPVASPEDIYECELLGEFIKPSPANARGAVMHGREGWIRVLEDQYGRPIPRKDQKALRPWFEIYDIVSWDAKSGARGLDLVKAVGELGRKYGCSEFHWDGYEQLMLADLVRSVDLKPIVHTWSGQGRKTEAVDHLRTLLVERRVALPNPQVTEKADTLKQELVRFRSRPTPGGNFQYIVAGGGGHGDHASCLTLAMRADLDGFVDRSPTKTAAHKHVVHDYNDPDDGNDY
jgi:hypothetical protein